MIQIKTDAEIALMREAGLVVGRTLQALAAAVAPGVTTARARRPRRGRDPRRGRRARRSRATSRTLDPAVPRVDLRLGQRRDRARHPRPAGAPGRRHHLDRLRRHPGRLARRRRRHRRGRGDLRGGPRAAPGHRGVDVARVRGRAARRAAHGHRPRHREPRPRRRATTASSRSTAGTGSAPRCTRSRTC